MKWDEMIFIDDYKRFDDMIKNDCVVCLKFE